MNNKLPLTGVITALAVILIIASSAATFGVLRTIPDQKGAATADASVPPPFAAAVDAGLRNADLSTGAALFEKYGCTTCHSTENGVAPYIVGTGQHAATRRAPTYSAAVYLYESIVDPDAYIVPTYPPGVMPQNFKATIPEKDMYALIAWLMKQ